MTKIANINLDIRKDSTIDNEPIVLRQGDSDVTIEASISNDGYPNVEIDFATFAAKKPDGTIISNDPANVNGNTISYPISKHLTDSVGKIHDAYFMINNKITTSGFDISIIPSAQLDENSVNYFPGLEDINKFLKSTETDWLGRIQQMKAQIAGLSIPDEFKLLMDKALSDAKAQYQPIIDAAEENVESIAADLAAKKLDLQNNSDELNTTITAIKAQISPVNSFLNNIQKQIIDANASFTADQQAKVSQSITDLKAQVSQSIANLKAQVSQSIANLKAQTDALVSGSAFQSLQTQVNNSAVGTNLLSNSRGKFQPNASKIDNNAVYFAPLAVSIYMTQGQQYTVHADASSGLVWSGTHNPRVESNNVVLWLVDLVNTNINVIISDANTGTGTTFTWNKPNGTYYFRVNTYKPDNSGYVENVKIEKGTTATDWCPNPSEILTQSDYAKIKAAIVALGGALS